MDASELAMQLKISPITAELLLARGADTPESARAFLYAGYEELSDPFEIPDMREAAARIRRACEEGESVVVFGDYDADGISSVSIFYQYLTDRGANAHWYVPEREEGYGLNTDAVEYIADTYLPDLIVTCDCGVSSHDEIEYIKDLGIEVIVTDHHELPELLPDCLVVNPKRGNNPATAMLCGAGVVFKVVEAAEGREYVRRFLDIAAIATVADSVPLSGENRILVREGLKVLNSDLRPGIRALRDVAGIKEFNSKSLAFSVVPRINAAGRVGAAKRAISLFCGQDEEEILSTAQELDRANSERQSVCDAILKDIFSSEEFRTQAGTRALILVNPRWQSGMIGIVASKLAERFCRPVFVFTESEGSYKGSGRSVEGVNLFTMLQSMSDLFVRYGGHSQAAGMTLLPERYEEFKSRVERYLADFPRSCFLRAAKGEMPIATADITLALCRELALLEPYGVGNRQPTFLLTDDLPLRPMKKHPAHFSGSVGQAGFTAFNAGPRRRWLCSPCKKDYLVDLSVNEYNNRCSPRANVRSFSIPFDRAQADKRDAVSWLLEALRGEESPAPLTAAEVAEALKTEYGVLVLSYDLAHLRRFLAETGLDAQVCCYADNRNNDSKILFSPDSDFEGEGYSKIVYLEPPVRGRKGSFGLAEEKYRLHISLERGVFGAYFRAISRHLERSAKFEDVRDLYDMIGKREELDEIQFFACLLTFLELGFFKLEENSLFLIRGVRAELEQSAFYRSLRDHLAE